MKVLIVDDELLVRVGIKSCIPWEEYGFEVIGMAGDGLEAVEIIKKERPDIVLTDIRMPNMDGLELIELISKEFSSIKSIVLSCLNEMDYVKRAIKLGAEDYILKLSMKPAVLIEVLQKTRENILQEQFLCNEKNSMELGLKRNKTVIKENLMREFFDNTITYEKFLNESACIQLNLDYEYYTVICCRIDDYSSAAERSRMDNHSLLKTSFLNIVEEKLSDYAKGELSEMANGEYIMLIDTSHKKTFHRKLLSDFLITLNQTLERYLNVTASFGIIENTDGMINIQKAYALARSAVEARFYLGSKSIIFSDNQITFVDTEIFLDKNDEKNMMEFVKSLDFDSVKALVDKFMEKIKSNSNHSPLRVKTSIINILYNIMKSAECTDKTEILDGFQHQQPTECILSAETLEEIQNLVDVYLDKLAEQSLAAYAEKKRPEIKALIRYIIENINTNISQKDAAKMVNMSRSYFSITFKKQTGECFTDFVNRLKMEKAYRLIIENNMKLYEVAERVGINDETYFNKLFKKYAGVTPGKVRMRE